MLMLLLLLQLLSLSSVRGQKAMHPFEAVRQGPGLDGFSAAKMKPDPKVKPNNSSSRLQEGLCACTLHAT